MGREQGGGRRRWTSYLSWSRYFQDQEDESAPPHSLRLSLLKLLLGLGKRYVLLHHFLGALGADLLSCNVEEVHSDGHPLIDLVPEPWAAVHLVENRVRPRQAREFLPRVAGG